MTGDRFPLPVNTGRVDGRAFPLAEWTARQHGLSTRLVETFFSSSHRRQLREGDHPHRQKSVIALPSARFKGWAPRRGENGDGREQKGGVGEEVWREESFAPHQFSKVGAYASGYVSKLETR